MTKKIAILMLMVMLSGTTAYAADCNGGGRYEVNGYLTSDGTVTDCETGLIWLQEANCTDSLGLTGIDKSLGDLDWYNAMTWVAALGHGHCGLNDGSYAGDWRLPTKTEWMAMVAYAKGGRYTNPALTNAAGTAHWTANGDAFNNVQSVFYWSSTTVAYDAYGAWDVHMGSGIVVYHSKDRYDYVWPVRGGQSGSFGSLTIE